MAKAMCVIDCSVLSLKVMNVLATYLFKYCTQQENTLLFIEQLCKMQSSKKHFSAF